MDKIRKPFQGVWNIIRFNWYFYALAFGFVLLIIFFRGSFPATILIVTDILLFIIIASILTSLLVSTYIYDFSNLYKLSWLDKLQHNEHEKIVNINAGFDETSFLLKEKFKDCKLTVLDFYDPTKHTEVSIKRARKVYPAFPNTQQVKTTELLLQDNSADKIFTILAAHEIRNEGERKTFFLELRRALSPTGQIFVTEHLRDTANFLAYNIGAFHFHSRASWLKAFQSSGLRVTDEIKITPFITTFILDKNGTTS